MRPLTAALAASQAADFLTSLAAQANGTIESNPHVVELIAGIGWFGYGYLKLLLVAYAAFVLYIGDSYPGWRRQLIEVIIAALAILTGFVALSNVGVAFS